MNKKLLVLIVILFFAGCSMKSGIDNVAVMESQKVGSAMDLTPSPTGTVRPTFTPSLTPTATSTFDYHRALEYSETSPDGEFIVDVYDYFYYGFTQCPVIEISDSNHNLLWHITCDFDPRSSPHKSMDFINWSLDGKELYYYSRYHGSGGDFAFREFGFNASKLDLFTGEIQTLFPEGTGDVAFTFSPSNEKVVYSFFGEDADRVYLHDFLSDETRSITLNPAPQPYAKTGDFHWSPNEEGIVFQTEAEWLRNENGAVYIEVQTVYLNALTMQHWLIHREALYEYMLEDWIDNRTIRIHQRNETTHQHEVYAVDVFTGEETLLPDLEPEW